MNKVNAAIVGCGNISGIYLKNLTAYFKNTCVYAVCDLIEENAKKAAVEYGIDKIMTLEEILADKNIDLVLNLTTPEKHYEICKKALESGKHVYVEKPLALNYKDGKELVDLAENKQLLIGCAPDTFMGAGIQTCIKIIEDGLVGEIIGAEAFMMCHGHESWHPNPEFYYKKGAGPMFDMGPYYITALVSMIGAVQSVSGMTIKGMDKRVITSQPKYGEIIDVEVPTHVNALLKFKNGAVGNIITSFDVWGSMLPKIEIHGTKGSIIVPDPNTFGGTVKLKQSFDKEFHDYPLLSKYSENYRGIGLSEMADCILNKKKMFSANGKKALHVLEIMEAIHTSSEQHKEINLQSDCESSKFLKL